MKFLHSIYAIIFFSLSYHCIVAIQGYFILKQGKTGDKTNMTLKEYNYSTPLQRKVVSVNMFFSCIILGSIFTQCAFTLKNFFFYNSYIPQLLTVFLTVLLAGNITGKAFFTFIKKSRIFYIITELLFAIAAAAFFMRSFYLSGLDTELILKHFENNNIYIFLLIFLPVFFLGIKTNYFLKVSSGKYIDEKTGASSLIFMFSAGLLAGGFLHLFLLYKHLPLFFNVFSLIPLLPFTFLIKAAYKPESFVAREIQDETEETESVKREFRDDILFNYLNFTYATIYLYLSALAFRKFQIPSFEEGMIFLYISGLSILAGYIFSIGVKKAFWHIYSEMLYPFFFFLYYIALSYFSGKIEPVYLILMNIPLTLLFGFTIFHSVKSIVSRFKQDKAYKVINISLFFLPLPIIAALSKIPFNNQWFFILFYVLTALNLIVPGLHLLQSRIKEYKKGIYFIVLLLTIPVYVVAHMYFNIVPDENLFINNSKNYEDIYKINFNSDFIPGMTSVSVKGKEAIQIDNNFYKNQKKAIITSSLFIDGENDSSLFIDGTRNFIYNTAYRSFTNAVCLNYIPNNLTDYNNLPVSGEKEIITINKNIYSFFYSNKNKNFDFILVNPNMIDYQEHSFLFSETFSLYLKERLTGKKTLGFLINRKQIKNKYIHSVFYNLSKHFKHHLLFSFGDQLLVLASDNTETFLITKEKLEKANLIASNSELLYYNGNHLLLYNIATDLKSYSFTKMELYPEYFQTKKSFPDFPLKDNLFSIEFSKTPNFFELIDSSIDKRYLNIFKRKYFSEEYILTRLIKAENFNKSGQYEQEISELTYLKARSQYNIELRKYINSILTIKKDSYIKTAKKNEEEKNWQKANELYNAVLKIDPSNFEATYRLGIISMTLQNFESADFYLNKALSLDKDNTDVMYQLGIILFANNDYKKALEYFKLSLSAYSNTPMAHFYIGMCYEQFDNYGNFLSAQKYYKNALALDPNNEDIVSAYKRIEKKIEEIKNAWKATHSNQAEEEEGEEMPIPVNQRAINSRLDDE